ncbi:PREDICTED: GATA transcription factor 4-like [Populus euphratica]|uniref:GATA transcription factor n=1 Tax=Populus euphratica TaxID=75702 RepID=A0AAJ6TU78_POPEU|nr:PREDICTED: GATA transcription factor 4-like [Populus euphratica]
MDVYGGVSTSAPDYFLIDDLLDFSNDDLLASSTEHHHLPPPETSSIRHHHRHFPSPTTYINNTSSLSTDFTDHLSVPSDDVADLEWLSQFMEDSFTDFPSTINIPTDTSSRNKSCSERSRTTTTATSSSADIETAVARESRLEKENNGAPHSSAETEGGARRCSHCASEKTPQWRTGPLGPKTLCNACGVRYKSGRLVPEYRPAASPTFVLTQHSNSHRKVLELRRQKEMTLRQQQQHGYQGYEVC